MQNTKIKILHQSENEIVVFKPAGIATQLSNDIKGSSLENILKKQLGVNDLFFPHRLDRVTSGLLLIAFNKEAIAFYGEEVKTTHFEKYYIAQVEDHTKNIRSLIGTHKRYLKIEGNVNTVVQSGGKTSFLDILKIQPSLKNKNNYNILIRLITGRKHQIRVMLADLGIPLCDDHLYNKKAGSMNRLRNNFYLESIILKFKDMDENYHTIYSSPEHLQYQN
ncbi:MAG: RNA pseudouridine synthase [Candidatus Delongbacteria bacterium]|jgi:23S rRNA-/tRNA-specific pseudouridylate synthase|nr:RNA pseudouridine synthase [Candidatus Delongbacteria bacterium]